MADFQTSTHRTKWIFTQQQLMDKYKVANKRAAQSLKKYGTASLEIDVDGSFSHPKRKRDSESNGEKHSSVKPLKAEDERMLHAFYENKIQEVCRAFFFPHKIQGTALIYYKRFYLHWSVMEHDPKYVMLTCVYLACKIEENHVSSEDLGKIIQLDHQLILDNEMLVLQSLGFDLIVYTPYRSIQGFIDDMEDFCYSTGGQVDLLKDLHQKSIPEADRAMLTDAPLLFPPGQLALAALRRANNELRVLDFERYVQSILSRQHSAHTLSELDQAFDAVDYLITTKTCDGEDMKRAAKKLKSCQDVGSHDGKKREKKSKRRSHKSSQDIQTTLSAATENLCFTCMLQAVSFRGNTICCGDVFGVRVCVGARGRVRFAAKPKHFSTFIDYAGGQYGLLTPKHGYHWVLFIHTVANKEHHMENNGFMLHHISSAYHRTWSVRESLENNWFPFIHTSFPNTEYKIISRTKFFFEIPNRGITH